jgi:GT2 family glycosyltransferase
MTHSPRTGKRYPLQKIIFADYTANAQTALCYRARGGHQYDERSDSICLSRQASLAFNTYCNSLNYDKWNTYTRAGTVFLELFLRGKFKILLKSEKYDIDDVQMRVFYFDSSLDAENGSPFIRIEEDGPGEKIYEARRFICSFSGLESFPQFYFEVIALSENAVVHGGEYFTLIDDPSFTPRPVHLAVHIHASTGEEKAGALLERLKSVLADETSPLRGNTRILLTDHGRGRPPKAWRTDAVHVFSDRNAGEAGGFARAILEILADGEQTRCTHLLNLAEDAVFYRDMPERLLRFLSLLKPAYARAVISLARLDLSPAYRQRHSAACWAGSGHIPLNAGYDLRDFPWVQRNEITDKANIAFWGAACFPAACLRTDALPLPLFSLRADTEFCLRIASEIITLNGLCVWRPYSAPPPEAEYYLARNTCIVDAVRGQTRSKKLMRRILFRNMWKFLWQFRYSLAELVFDGIEDFCRGPGWLRGQNPEELHNAMLARAPREQPVRKQRFGFLFDNYAKDRKMPPASRLGRMIRALTLNGWLLSPVRTRVLPVSGAAPRQLYRARQAFFYNEQAQTGYLAARSYKQARALILRWWKMCALLDARYDAACREYREQRNDLRSLEFWRGYLRPAGEEKK